MSTRSRDVTGLLGEKIVDLCLTKCDRHSNPLFRPRFLGDKWPAIDFYVELVVSEGRRHYFFAQVRATSRPLLAGASKLRISAKRADVADLLQIPGPTYMLAVHEPTGRVFVRAVHALTPARAITGVPTAHELTPDNLRRLYTEVGNYWSENTRHKPEGSEFS